MSKKKEESERFVFVRDDERSVLGFSTFEAAKIEADSMGPKDTDDRRVRICYRSRTEQYDVVVKTKRAVKSVEKHEVRDTAADRVIAEIADHAGTGR